MVIESSACHVATLKRTRHHLDMTEPVHPEVVGNKAVEDAAIAYVINYEGRHGRTAHDTRHRGAPADVQSEGRLIEVKAAGRSARGFDMWLEVRQVEEARVTQSSTSI